MSENAYLYFLFYFDSHSCYFCINKYCTGIYDFHRDILYMGGEKAYQAISI